MRAVAGVGLGERRDSVAVGDVHPPVHRLGSELAGPLLDGGRCGGGLEGRRARQRRGESRGEHRECQDGDQPAASAVEDAGYVKLGEPKSRNCGSAWLRSAPRPSSTAGESRHIGQQTLAGSSQREGVGSGMGVQHRVCTGVSPLRDQLSLPQREAGAAGVGARAKACREFY